MKLFFEKNRRLLASILGNIIEWYDFSVYSFLATTIGSLFFYSQNSTVMLLKVFSVFAVGYLARPFGGIIFGHLGDKYGRSKALRISMYLMALSTFGMGLLPTFKDVGILATILLILLRIFQGISAGGEFVGSTVYMFEVSATKRKSLWCSWVTFSCTVGVLMGSLVSALLHHFFTSSAIMNGIWRIPYLLGIILAGFGIWARKILAEPQPFANLISSQRLVAVPLWSAFKLSWRAMLQMVSLNIFMAIAFYGLFVWMPTYLHVFLHQPEGAALMINTAIMILLVVLTPLMAMLADATNRIWVAFLSPLLITLFAYSLFHWLIVGNLTIIFFGLAIFAIFFSLIEGTTAAISANLFPIRHRLSGLGLSYNFSMSFFGGTTPLVCTYLIARFHSLYAPAFYVAISGVIGMVALITMQVSRRSQVSTSVEAAESVLN